MLRACIRAVLAGLAALALANEPALGDSEYPIRPVTLIVPFAAGGPTDMVARIIADQMGRTLGQTLVIENVVGAGGTTGTIRAKRAPADGYTIMVGHLGTHAAAAALNPKLAYDPVADFEPVGLVAGTPVLVLARKDLAVTSLAELVQQAETHRLRMAHAGVGSVSYTFCSMLNQIMAAKPELVSFNGTGPAMDALVAGQVDYMCDQIVSAVRPIETQAIKAFAIGTAERSPVLPHVPTAVEAGMPQFQGSAWNALFAPKGMPRPLIDKINAALATALDDADTRKQLVDLGCIIPGAEARPPEALRNLVRDEIAKWSKVLGGGVAAVSTRQP
jgi:tripartite-type tricarboxylate transporter receptor subunit TctC